MDLRESAAPLVSGADEGKRGAERMAEEAATAGRSRRRQRFLREVGGVVLGVLIALGIGEIAEAIRWQVRIDRGKTAMRAEMAGNRFNMAERAAMRPCIARRLDAIASVVEAARRGAPLPAIGGIVGPPDRIGERAAFDVAMAEGILLHSDAGEARDIALIYDVVAGDFATQAAAERSAWTTLKLIEDVPGPIDGDSLLAVRQALIEARAQAAAIDVTIARADLLLANKGVGIEYEALRDAAGLAQSVRASPICQPLRVRA